MRQGCRSWPGRICASTVACCIVVALLHYCNRCVVARRIGAERPAGLPLRRLDRPTDLREPVVLGLPSLRRRLGAVPFRLHRLPSPTREDRSALGHRVDGERAASAKGTGNGAKGTDNRAKGTNNRAKGAGNRTRGVKCDPRAWIVDSRMRFSASTRAASASAFIARCESELVDVSILQAGGRTGSRRATRDCATRSHHASTLPRPNEWAAARRALVVAHRLFLPARDGHGQRVP